MAVMAVMRIVVTAGLEVEFVNRDSEKPCPSGVERSKSPDQRCWARSSAFHDHNDPVDDAGKDRRIRDQQHGRRIHNNVVEGLAQTL